MDLFTFFTDPNPEKAYLSHCLCPPTLDFTFKITNWSFIVNYAIMLSLTVSCATYFAQHIVPRKGYFDLIMKKAEMN